MNPLAGVIREAWRLYRAHAGHLLVLAFVIYVVAAIVQAVLTGLLGTLGALLAAVVTIVAAFLVQAAMVTAVDDIRDGRADLDLGQTVRAAQPYVVPVAAASILAGIGITIGLILLLVPGLILLTIWALIVPVIVLERRGALEAFGRSRALVRGYGWQVFGTLVLVFLVLLAADIVIGVVLRGLPDAARGVVGGVVSGTLVAPFTALVLTLGYFRLRAAHTAPGTPTYGTL